MSYVNDIRNCVTFPHVYRVAFVFTMKIFSLLFLLSRGSFARKNKPKRDAIKGIKNGCTNAMPHFSFLWNESVFCPPTAKPSLKLKKKYILFKNVRLAFDNLYYVYLYFIRNFKTMADQSQNIKQQFILSAGKELFWKHGVKRVTVEEICVQASVSKMTFYKFFMNKRE